MISRHGRVSLIVKYRTVCLCKRLNKRRCRYVRKLFKEIYTRVCIRLPSHGDYAPFMQRFVAVKDIMLSCEK